MSHAEPNETDPLLLKQDDGGVRTLKLNNPRKRNPLSMTMMQAVIDALDEADADPNVHVIVIASTGPVFCSGHDLKEVRGSKDRDFHQALFIKCSEMMMRVQSVRQATIARVQGPATAAGCQLVATCDLAVVSDSATFTTPGVNIGLFCATPMVALSRNVPVKQAMRMLLSGDHVTASQALQMGLVSDVVATADLKLECASLAARIAAKSPRALAIGKAAFYRQAEMTTAEAYAFASDVMTTNMQDPDATEGIDAFLTKRRAQWPSASTPHRVHPAS
jgi:enoyl-CoA hydratase/carnithine racemase